MTINSFILTFEKSTSIVPGDSPTFKEAALSIPIKGGAYIIEADGEGNENQAVISIHLQDVLNEFKTYFESETVECTADYDADESVVSITISEGE